MRAADVLRELGRPIAYYPFLARYLGGVNASVLFCQIFYWQDKATNELGVHKTVEELEHETGLSYEEQRAARTKLRASGVLIETAKRIEHRTYFRIDEDALERLLSADPPTRKPKRATDSTLENTISRNGKSPSREIGKVHLAKSEIPTPPDGESLARGRGEVHPVSEGVITSETTAATRATDAVDNFAVAAAAELKAESLATERAFVELLVGLERERGKDLPVDRGRDRLPVVTWVGKGVTLEQLRKAYGLAVAARHRDRDERPTYTSFVATFVDQVLTDTRPPTVAVDTGPWYAASPEVIEAHGAAHGVRTRQPDEPIARYRVLVAKAARDRSAVDYVLKDARRFNDERLFNFARETFGDALLPPDF